MFRRPFLFGDENGQFKKTGTLGNTWSNTVQQVSVPQGFPEPVMQKDGERILPNSFTPVHLTGIVS